MMPRLAALALVSVLSAAPALAEKAATGATVPKAGGVKAGSVKAGGVPAATAPTKAATMKGTNEAEMLKAQKASAARDKAWDARTRNSMTSICKGC